MPRTSARRSTGDRSLHVRVGRILHRTGRAFIEDNVSRLGAALAFYTTVAVAPLMVLALAVAGVFFEESQARESVLREIRLVIGRPAAEALGAVQSPLNQVEGVLATVIGTVTLVFGAFGVFQHLQDALNSIWRTHAPSQIGFWAMVRRRLFSASVVLATGFLLLVSLILSAALNWLGSHAIGHYQLSTRGLEVANAGLSLMVVTLLFALIFKLLPDTRVPWRHVWLGSSVTAVLFTLGKSAMGLYLAHAKALSAYGAASSLIALLLWCYYASQIVFLGAEFTRITSLSNGGRDFSLLARPEQRVRQSHVPVSSARAPR
ncbi:MAG TPA: YihY/virulence factor BrkB family protein [Candidatus Didemnitutus sp.]|nr:YihY/virulence factor BrkB family protein [Candidatus Didemnitutus sp.]